MRDPRVKLLAMHMFLHVLVQLVHRTPPPFYIPQIVFVCSAHIPPKTIHFATMAAGWKWSRHRSLRPKSCSCKTQRPAWNRKENRGGQASDMMLPCLFSNVALCALCMQATAARTRHNINAVMTRDLEGACCYPSDGLGRDCASGGASCES